MIRCLWTALLLGLSAPVAALANPIPEELHLWPARSAVDYSRSRGHDLGLLWLGDPSLHTSRADACEIDYRIPLVPEWAAHLPGILFAMTHHAEPGGAGSRLRKIRDKLFITVTAYEAGNLSKRWEGLDETAETERGRTLDLSDGRFRGDLSVGIGAEAGVASLSDLTNGTLDVLVMNPIRDVSAQFDFLVRVGALETRSGFDAFIIRVRAVYVDAFRGNNDDSTATTEYTLSMGLSW